MIKLIIIFFIVMLDICFAQTDSLIIKDSLNTHQLNILSNFDNAKIYFDTSYIGKTPLENFPVKEGQYEIKIFNPKSSKLWEYDNREFGITINKDTTLIINFSYYYYINTNPFEAKVYWKDSLFGFTPLRFFSEKKIEGSFVIRKKNYKDYIYDLTNYNFETGADINLKPKGTLTINDEVYKNKNTQFKTKRNLFAIFPLSALAVASAFSAYNFKSKGNEAYNLYLENSNEEDLNRSNQNDIYFVISLVVMQAAIGGLIYFLFFDK